MLLPLVFTTYFVLIGQVMPYDLTAEKDVVEASYGQATRMAWTVSIDDAYRKLSYVECSLAPFNSNLIAKTTGSGFDITRLGHELFHENGLTAIHEGSRRFILKITKVTELITIACRGCFREPRGLDIECAVASEVRLVFGVFPSGLVPEQRIVQASYGKKATMAWTVFLGHTSKKLSYVECSLAPFNSNLIAKTTGSGFDITKFGHEKFGNDGLKAKHEESKKFFLSLTNVTNPIEIACRGCFTASNSLQIKCTNASKVNLLLQIQ